jgi:hypothetical protein
MMKRKRISPPKMVTTMYTAKTRRDHFFGS